MPDQITPSFAERHQENLEHVTEEVMRGRELFERQRASGKEKVKRAIQQIPPRAMDEEAKEIVESAEHVIHDPLPAYAGSAPAETKLEVEYLLELAFKKGIGAANKAAMGSSPFVIDAFHDALAGRLYPELKKRGVVE
jgi:hypothetical protein